MFGSNEFENASSFSRYTLILQLSGRRESQPFREIRQN